MKFHRSACASLLLLLLLLTATSRAQLVPPTTQPPVGKVLSEFKADNSIDAVVAQLQKEDPDLKLLLVRDQGAPANQPHVNLLLKNVVAHDVLSVITSVYPNLVLTEIPGKTGPIYVLRVFNPNGGGGVAAAQQAEEPVVKVYKLSSYVDGWIGYNMPDVKVDDVPAARKKAIDQILSLIQAALTQTSQDQGKAILQVHEPTQTLVFKGTREQRLALEDALQALQQPGTRRVEGLSGRVEHDIDTLKSRMTSMEQEIVRLKGAVEGRTRGSSMTRPSQSGQN